VYLKKNFILIMCHLLSNSLRNCLSISFKSNRFLSGIKSEIDLEVKRIRKWKRIFAFSLFGITLTTTILMKNNKRKEWLQLLQQTKRLQVFRHYFRYYFRFINTFIIINYLFICKKGPKVWRFRTIRIS
jgi:hypothetical protein